MPGLSLRQRAGAAGALMAAAWRAARGDAKGTTRVLSQFLPAPSTRRFARAGTLDLLLAYSEIPAVRTCVDLVADAYARIIWEAYKAGSRNQERRMLQLRSIRSAKQRADLRGKMVEAGDVILDADVIKFLDAGSIDPRNPTEGLDGYQTRSGSMKHRLLAGERFVIMDREGVGRGARKRGLPASQVLIMPHQVQGIPTQTERFFIVRDAMGMLHEIPAEDVLWQKEVDPADVYGRGTGAAHALSTELAADEAMAGHVAEVFQRGGRPDLLLVGDFGGDGPEADAKRKRAELRWEMGVRRHLPYFMSHSGDDEGKPAVTVHDLSQSFVNMDARNLRGFGWEIIRQVLGRIPPELLGVTGNSNRATIDAAWYVLSTGTVLPLCEGDRSFYRARLLPEFGEGIDLDFQSPVDEDWDFHLRAMQARPQAFTLDDWRGMAGQQDLDGGKGKVFLWTPGDVPVTDPTKDPFAFAPSVPNEPVPSGQNPKEPPEDPEAIEESLLDLPLQGARRRVNGAGDSRGFPVKHSPVERAASYVLIDRIAAAMEGRLAKLFLAAVERRRAEINESDLVAALVSRNFAAVYDALPVEAFGADVLRSQALLQEVYGAAGAAAAKALGGQLGKEVPFDAEGRRAVVWAPGRGRELQEWAAESVRESARLVAEHGDAAAWSAAATAGAIGLTFGLASFLIRRDGRDVPGGPALQVLAHRAELEASGMSVAEAQGAAASYRDDLVRHRAETFGGGQSYSAAQSGQVESWRQARDAGAVSRSAKKYWVTRDNPRVCPICDAMHGQKRELDQPFVSSENGESYMLPGDPHEGCLCALLFVDVRGSQE